MEEDRARLLRSPVTRQQQEFALSSEAVEAESREAAMRDMQVWVTSIILCCSHLYDNRETLLTCMM